MTYKKPFDVFQGYAHLENDATTGSWSVGFSGCRAQKEVREKCTSGKCQEITNKFPRKSCRGKIRDCDQIGRDLKACLAVS